MGALKKIRSRSVFSGLTRSNFQYYISVFILLFSFCFEAQNITKFEYFIGNDPGFGLGTEVTATASGSEVNQNLAIDLTGEASGFNRLSIRAFDDDMSTWSLYHAVTFYISDFTGSTPISNLQSAEYWFDADPGVGNRTALSITGNPSELTESFVIPLGSLLAGFHTLSIRIQNLDNTWSLYEKKTFYITDFEGSTPISNLKAAEYWFDSNPAPGGGTALAITGNPSELTESFAILLGTLDVGFHTLSVRIQNLDDIWSLYDKKTFYVSDITGSAPISDLQRLEYYLDTDPGFGNGTAIAITGAPNEYADSFVIPLGSLDGGFHEIGIRAQNLDGTWSLFDKKRFFIIDTADFATPPTAALDEIEFLYDAELGFGTGTPLAFTSTGNPDEYLVEIPTDLVTCEEHDIWISMKNADGNYSMYSILDNVDVFDNLPPTIVTFPNITAELNATGQASITIADVDNGTFDDCELDTVVLDQAQFDYTCADLGANTVTVTATDAIPKVSTEDVTITVVDNINPVAIAQNITVQLDGTGNATITGAQIDNSSTDNCSVTSFSLDVSSFDCTNLGANTVTLTATDQSGNDSTNAPTATVTVQDLIKPTVLTQAITVQLNDSGEASITPVQIDNGSTDNCTINTRSLDITAFTCANLGANTVTITVTDQSGNSETGTATVTVEDSINPVAITQNITVQLDANGDASITPAQIENGSTDNCSVTGFSLDVSSFTCANLGANTVSLTVSDSSGNMNSANATVTVEDNINPVAITQAFTAQLDASGNVTITADDVDNSSTDNCAVTTKSLDISSFTCTNLGPNTVMLTVGDISGNTNTASATVTVEDSVNPTVVTQNITVQLDASGSASITTGQIENGSTDNCSISSSSLDITSFDCNDLGANTVTLSVIDQSNNTGTNTATVTVEDNINPVAITQAFTAQLDATGNVTITGDDVDNSSTDNCAVTTKSLDVSSFTCANLGPNTVMLTVGDISGNTNTASATVTVEDSVNPTVVTQNITVQLDASGSASITAGQIENGSTDNCSISSSSLDITSFDCNDLGANIVTLSVIDQSNNTGTNTATVTVEDNINPVAVAQNITVQLDATGNVIIPDQIENGSTDNCSITGYSVDVSSLTCANLGPNTVMLTVEDASGNTNTTSATITVEDNVNPVAIGQDITRDLAGNASVMITASEVDNGSSDNCSTTNLSIDVDTFTTVGVYQVILTATDGSANQNTTTVMVTIEDTSLDIEEFEITADNILLYPNPSEGELFISTKLIIDSVDIYNINGRYIKSVNKPGKQINLKRISSGMYFLKFKIENMFVTKRLVKE